MEDAQRGRSSAYGKLMSLAEELRKSDSSLSVAQSFEKVYSDPANLALTTLERRQARAKFG